MFYIELYFKIQIRKNSDILCVSLESYKRKKRAPRTSRGVATNEDRLVLLCRIRGVICAINCEPSDKKLERHTLVVEVIDRDYFIF